MYDVSQASDLRFCDLRNSLPQPDFQGVQNRRSEACDPLGLTPEQREISNLTIGMGVLDGPFAGLADALLACPLCRAYECLPGCLSRLAPPDAEV